jgi:hypothetical protein
LTFPPSAFEGRFFRFSVKSKQRSRKKREERREKGEGRREKENKA